MLVPTTKGGLWSDFGKVLFAACDILAGWLIFQILVKRHAMQTQRALQYASIWLLNPMVAQISTRGSSEGVVAVMVMCLLWACLTKRWSLAGVLLGLSVHFKVYPLIYAASIIWWADDREVGTVSRPSKDHGVLAQLQAFANIPRLKITAWSAITFLALNVWMMTMYAWSNIVMHNSIRLTCLTATATIFYNIHTSTISSVLITDITSPCTTCCSTSMLHL